MTSGPSRLPFLLLAGLSWVLHSACRDASAVAAAPPPAPPKVSVVTVAPERVALTSEWIATLDGYVNAQIRPQVSGYLVKRNYEEGAVVRKGEVLFEIDPRPFEAVLAQAEAQLARGARRSSARPSATCSATGRSPSSAPSRRASSTTTCRRNLAAQAAVEVGDGRGRDRAS